MSIVDDVINALLNSGSFLAEIQRKIERAVRDTFENVANGIRALFASITNAVGDTIRGLAGRIRDLAENLFSAISGAVNQLADGVGRLVARVTDAISNALRDIGPTLAKIVSTIASEVGKAIGKLTDAISNVADKIGDALRRVVNSITERLGDIIDKVTSTVGKLLGQAGDAIRSVAQRVIDTAGAVINKAAEGLAFIAGTVSDAVSTFLALLGQGVGALVDQLSGLPSALVEVGTQLTETIVAAATGAGESLAGFLNDPLQGILGSFFHGNEPEAIAAAEALINRILGNPALDPAVRTTLVDARAGGKPVWFLVLAFLIPMVAGNVIGGALQPAVAKMVQEENKALRPSLLTLGDLVNATYRDKDGHYSLQEAGARLGYENEDIALAVEISRPLPPVGEVLDWVNRELVSEGAGRRLLESMGYDDKAVATFLEARQVIPPLQDLVRFVVREALPGQSAYGGEAGGSVPGSFTKLAGHVGLTPEFARSYWAAHWELPAIGQAFEMFQRGVIDAAQLRAYLVTADVMPEWRERLIKISYNPLTRVDVRRMYGLGLLSLTEVAQAYEDLGYSPANARALAEFTKAEAQHSEADAGSTERDLTRADIVGAYADAVYTRNEAEAGLRSLGYSADEAGLLLDREDIKIAAARRKAIRDSITFKAVHGALTREAAEDAFNRAGFTTDEVAYALQAIDDAIAAKVRMPSRADLFRFRKVGVITEDQLRAGLVQLGYQAPALDWFMALAAKGQEPPPEVAA